MIEIIASASIGATVGFLTCAFLTAGKVADSEYAAGCLDDAFVEASKAHAHCADALSTTHRKLSAIRDLINKPETVRKGVLASILDGDHD